MDELRRAWPENELRLVQAALSNLELDHGAEPGVTAYDRNTVQLFILLNNVAEDFYRPALWSM